MPNSDCRLPARTVNFLKMTRFFPLLLILLSLSSCVQLPDSVRPYARWAVKKLFPELLKKPASPAATATTGSASYSSQAAKEAKANAELLHEMDQVIYIHEPENRSDFGNMVDSMNQGASLEGIYNGLVHSSDYRKLEVASPGSTAEALHIFCEQLASLEAELPMPTKFDATSAQPLALPVQPSADDSAVEEDFGQSPSPSPSANAPFDKKAWTEKYSQIFVGSSIYTLKRILGDEALKVVAVKKDYPSTLYQWYSQWAVHMTSYGVDFGLEQRNSTDPQFHYDWAKSASQDRLEWEILNRIHRVLNDANRHKQ